MSKSIREHGTGQTAGSEHFLPFPKPPALSDDLPRDALDISSNAWIYMNGTHGSASQFRCLVDTGCNLARAPGDDTVVQITRFMRVEIANDLQLKQSSYKGCSFVGAVEDRIVPTGLVSVTWRLHLEVEGWLHRSTFLSVDSLHSDVILGMLGMKRAGILQYNVANVRTRRCGNNTRVRLLNHSHTAAVWVDGLRRAARKIALLGAWEVGRGRGFVSHRQG